MIKPFSRAKVALQLGPFNLFRVGGYRLGVRYGLNPVRRLEAEVAAPPFFASCDSANAVGQPRSGWFEHAEAFGLRLSVVTHLPPQWLASSLSGEPVPTAARDWWLIPDFDPAVGDIKTVWEASRFDWVLSCAEHMLVGDEDGYRRLEAWLSDWCANNPPYKGPNWKCGQEASIRIMHLAMAALMLGQVSDAATGLRSLIHTHLQRIAPTIQYAIAQDNNHGTSEAAALFIGGTWLGNNRWAKEGRRWLENRANRLIALDGSFSQYSLNYHRVMMDTMVMAEVWRRSRQLPKFSPRFYQRCSAATLWLHAMIQPESGDGPNLGANDGARLLPLTDTDYRDYRPSVQLASAVFLKKRAYAKEGDWNLPLSWLKLDLPQEMLPAPSSRQFDDGGYTVLRDGSAMAMLRYPRFRFRPSQADAMHLDFWLGGENWLRDGGSYSYNTDPELANYFPGTQAHNTVEFDGRDQMPRISRFLFGDWLKTRSIEPLATQDGMETFAAGYRDRQGCEHVRRIALKTSSLRVEDKVQGFHKKAVLRWRLKPGNWVLEGTQVSCDGVSLTVASSVPLKRIELVQGWESRYYLQKTALPVLEVEIDQPGELATEINWELS
ncbi:heparinase II/III-family protein [Halopseudomonas laoshanensis]|uniref:heparinase II/III family protein n=1 Tax=Halopseudomonas laoshanensis TaxID=2268758 RepID=UPI003735CDF9